MNNEKSLISTGLGLVTRHKRIFWWIFFVGLVLSFFGTLAPSAVFGKILNRSMHARSVLVQRFDLISFADLTNRPEVSMGAFVAGSIGLQIVFFAFMLFISGGILTTYREDRRLSAPEFFESCGLYFWRFFRLMLLSLIPLGIVAAINALFSSLTGKLSDATPRQDYVFYSRCAGMFVVIVLALLVRLWFDIAQVRAVAQNERGMIRNAWRALKITWGALGTLLWMYLRISLVAWITLGLGLWLWSYMPSAAYSASWLLLEVILAVQIAVRLWLRASAITWYQRYAEQHPVITVDFTTPRPLEIVDQPTVAPQSEPAV